MEAKALTLFAKIKHKQAVNTRNNLAKQHKPMAISIILEQARGCRYFVVN